VASEKTLNHPEGATFTLQSPWESGDLTAINAFVFRELRLLTQIIALRFPASPAHD
jgi:hypothetical protein